MNRLSLLACVLLCSCLIVQPPLEEPAMSAPAPAPRAVTQDVAPAAPAPPAAAASSPVPAPLPPPAGAEGGFVCDGFMIQQGVVPPRECRIWPRPPASAVPGIEALPGDVRECVLQGLPGMTPDTQPGWCQTWAARMLQDRLQQLGWLDAQVAPGESTGSGERPPRVWVTAQPGARYQIGGLEAQVVGSSPWLPFRIVEEARKAIPAGAPWYTRSTLEAVHATLMRTTAFKTVDVQVSAPDRERMVVPLLIVATTETQLRKAAPRCPAQLPCPFGEWCEVDPKRRCRICHCTFKYGS